MSEFKSEVMADIYQAMLKKFSDHHLAASICDALRSYFGGQQIYIAKEKSIENSERDREIWELFNGNNQVELAKAYDLTTRQIHSILSEQRCLYMQKNQRNVF